MKECAASFAKNFFKKEYLATLAICTVFAYGFFLRTYELDSASLWIDEGYTMMQEKAVSLHGYPLLESGHVEPKDVLLPYLLAGVRILEGENVAVFRLVSALFGILSVWLAFLLGKKIGGRHIAFLSAFFMTFSYWQVAWSRQIRSYSLLAACFLLAVLCVFYYEEKQKTRYLIFAFLAVSGAILAKTSFGLLLIPALALYLFLKKKFALLLFAGFSGLASALFFSRMLTKALGVSLVNNSGFYLVGYFWAYFGIFFLLALGGFYIAVTENKKYLHAHFFNAACFFVPLVYFSFFVSITQRRYLFFVTPLIFFYSAYFIYQIAKVFFEKRLILALSASVMALLCIDFLTVKTFVFAPSPKYALEEYTPQPDFKSAYGKIKEDENSESVIVSPYPYMDKIYLGRADWALPISYTGRKEDGSMLGGKEFYSGVPGIYSAGELEKIRSVSDAYIILDSMGESRIDKDVYAYIKEKGKLLFQDLGTAGQGITVYKMKKAG